jgi:hypothetical protein
MIGEFSFVSGSPVAFDRADGGSARIEGPMLKEGVWNGIYVPAAAIEEALPSILGRYWLSGHLDEGSEPSWHSTAMGLVSEAELRGDEAETWIVVEPWLDRIPPDLTDALESGERVGVSADFRAQFVEEEGEFNGVPYSERVLHMYYLHVAYVPLGACSVDDGCFSRMSFKSGVGVMTKKSVKEKLVHQADDDEGEVEEGTVTVVSFNKPDDVRDFVQMVQDQDDPAVAAEMLIGLAEWVVTNWEDGTGPFIAPLEPVEEGFGKGGKKVSEKKYAKKVDDKEPAKLSPTKAFIKRRLQRVMPNLTEERFEEAYNGVDEEVLITILEDVETLLDSVTQVAEEVEEIVEEIEDEVGEGETGFAKSTAKRSPPTKIKIQRSPKTSKPSFAEMKKGYNKRLGIKCPKRETSGGSK